MFEKLSITCSRIQLESSTAFGFYAATNSIMHKIERVRGSTEFLTNQYDNGTTKNSKILEYVINCLNV